MTIRKAKLRNKNGIGMIFKKINTYLTPYNIFLLNISVNSKIICNFAAEFRVLAHADALGCKSYGGRVGSGIQT